MTKLNEIINIESTISGYGNDVNHLSCRCINIIILFSPKKNPDVNLHSAGQPTMIKTLKLSGLNNFKSFDFQCT